MSDAAIRRAVAEHNRVCALIRALGDFRKEVRPRITGYEFHVLTLATYVAPKYLLIDKLEESLEEVRSREPEERAYRARIALVGSEVDDSEFIRLIEDTGAYVCADRFCFGSLPGRDPIVLTDEEDALTQICRQYVYRGQCPRTMNMEKVYGRKQYVADIAREYHADGILYEQIKFCDPWAYERTLGSVMLREDFGFRCCLWTVRTTSAPRSARCARACRPLSRAWRSKIQEVSGNGDDPGQTAHRRPAARRAL